MSYVGAPYNFVRFPKKIYKPTSEDAMKVHGKIDKNLLSGEISFTITAQTPIFVDDGNGEFFTNEYGKYAIPGSSIRGLLRNNVQILSASDVSADVDDYSLMYRHVASGALKKDYNDVLGNKIIQTNKGSMSVLQNVSSGYISCENGEYYIYPAGSGSVGANLSNYYVLSERTIIDSFLHDEKSSPFQLFVGKNKLQHKVAPFNKSVDKNGRTHYKGVPNNEYEPYFIECSYENEGSKVTRLEEPGVCSQKGYIISSGYMQEKKALYLVPEINADVNARIKISKEDVASYKVDFKAKENILKSMFKGSKEEKNQKAGKFFGFPAEGVTKPVFYIHLNKLYFGFTPRLRLFYDHTVKEGYRSKNEGTGFDMATSLFGLSDNDLGSFKSKVSFPDAVASCGESGKRESIVLAGPKPSSYLDYLIQNDEADTYNTDSFELRGVKQYWLHDKINLGTQNTNNENIGSPIHPLKEGTEFNGCVRFNNLNRKELGLLLWAIRLEPGNHMNIGMGKPYGFGHIEISGIQAKLVDYEKAYSFDNLELNPYTDITSEIGTYVDEYKKTEINGKAISESESVKDFLKMKNTKRLPEEDNIKYMNLDDGDYKNRVKNVIPLGTIDEVIVGKEPDPLSKNRSGGTRNSNNRPQSGKNDKPPKTKSFSGDSDKKPKKEITVTVTRTLPGNKGEAMDKGKPVKISNIKLVDGVKTKDNVIVRVTRESNKEIIAEYVRKA